MQQFIITILLLSIIGTSVFGQDSLSIQKTGLYTGFNIGTWFPDSENKVLGNPPIIGITLDLKGMKNSLGVNFDLIGWPQGKTTEPIQVKFGNSLLVRNEYSGAQVTIDYGRQFYETKRFAFEGIGSIGYGEISYYNPDQYTNVSKKSLILSPGLSIRYAIVRKLFIQLKTQYCIANYNLNDNVSTNLSGNYLITKLIISGLSNNR